MANAIFADDKPARRFPRWLFGVLLVLLLAGGAIAGASYYLNSVAPPDRTSPSATVSGYFDALKRADYARAWQYAADSRSDATTQSAFASTVKSEDTRLGSVQSYQITSTTSDSTGRITVSVSVQRGPPTNGPVSYTLVLGQYEGSLWLIQSVTAV